MTEKGKRQVVWDARMGEVGGVYARFLMLAQEGEQGNQELAFCNP